MNIFIIISQLLITAISFTTVGVMSTAKDPEPTKLVYVIQSVVYTEPKPKVKTEKVVYKKTEQLSPKSLKAILFKAGFRGIKLREAWGIAMVESTGRPMSHNQNASTGDNSYGLFQINMIDSLGPARRKQFNLKTNKDLFDPLRNAEIAYFMSNGGKNWSSWRGVTEKALGFMQSFP